MTGFGPLPTSAVRPLYVDITGTTDANGNASIPVQFPRMTGRWHNAKFTLGLSAPAEWAILVNGRPYTYGRGRRVTLGPELIQDGETVAVSVIGGPQSATVDGTCTGVSGPPDEIMSSFTPAPNTIALDAFNTSVLIGTVKNVGSSDVKGPTTIQLPGGAQGVGFAASMLAPNVVAAKILIVGHQTGLTYVDNELNVPFGLVQTASWATELYPEDTSLDVTVTGAAAASPSVTFIHAYSYNPRVRLGSQNLATPVYVRQTPTVQPFDVFADSGEPGGGATATVTIAAAAAGVRNVASTVQWELQTGAGGAAGVFRVRLRDGASGVGPILRSWLAGTDGTQGHGDKVELSGLAIPGSVNTAMTLEFASGAANIFQSVGLGVYQE